MLKVSGKSPAGLISGIKSQDKERLNLMSGKNLLLKLGMVVLLVAASFASYQYVGLKYGTDIAGGTILTFQVDQSVPVRTAIEVTTKRIDPNGLLGLEIVPMRGRFQVKMPAPSAKSRKLGKIFRDKRQALLAINVTPGEISDIQNATGQSQKDLIAKLAKKNPQQAKAVEDLMVTYGELLKARAELVKSEKQVAVEGKKLKADPKKRDEYKKFITDMSKKIADAKAKIATLDAKYRGEMIAINENNVTIYQISTIFSIYDKARITDNPKKKAKLARAYQKRIDEFLNGVKVKVAVTDAMGATVNDAEGKVKTREIVVGAHPAYKTALEDTISAYKNWIRYRRALEDPADLIRLIKQSGVLEFRIAVRRANQDSNDTVSPATLERLENTFRKEGAQLLLDTNSKYVWIPVQEDEQESMQSQGFVTIRDEADRLYVLLANSAGQKLVHENTEGALKWELDGAWPSADQLGAPAISFKFDARGAKLFGDLTGANKDKNMAIILDGNVYSAPTIQTRISEQGQITGNFSAAEARDLARVLSAGRLPGKIEGPVNISNFGPSIGAENLSKGKRAAIIGLVAVAAFMLIYYLLCGAIANVALMLNMIFIIGAMSLFGSALTLPGIAGLILTIGMAVDANVLIFERLREEQLKGIAVKQAIRNAYDRAFTAIFDANLTTLLVCLFLYVVFGYVGMEQVRGFAITLGLGVLFSMFTALIVTRWLFLALGKMGMLNKPLTMLQLIPTMKVNWIAKRKVFWGISAVMIVVGLVSLFAQGRDIFGIELSSGTKVTIRLKSDALIQVGDKLNLPNDENVRQRFAQIAKETKNDKLINASVTKVIDENKVSKFLQQFGPEATKVSLDEWNKMGMNPDFFAELDKNSDKSITKNELEERLPDFTYEVTTSESNSKVVRDAIFNAFAGKMQERQNTQAKILTSTSKTAANFSDFITSKSIEDRDMQMIKLAANGVNFIDQNTIDSSELAYQPTFRKFRSGWFFVVNIDAPDRAITVDELKKRIDNERQQEQFKSIAVNKYEVLGIELAGQKQLAGKKFQNFLVFAKANQANASAGATEYKMLASSLEREDSLIMFSFDPQQSTTTFWIAMLAVVLSWSAIVIYLWLRFGSIQWGFAAVICLVHDVSIVVGMVAATGWLSQTGIGEALGIGSFKISLAMIAAILTVIGYSVNDSIVVFDRIRENRGKLKAVSVRCINDSINQTLPRTLLTSFTTFLVVGIMYIWGGQGIRAFNYALIIGIIFGTYSSVAVASPLLLGFRRAFSAGTIADDEVAIEITDEDETGE